MTYDEMAVEVLLGEGTPSEKQAKLTKLAVQAKDQLENRIPCPDCGNAGPHDDNGMTGLQLSYCCSDCGMHFDAHPERA